MAVAGDLSIAWIVVLLLVTSMVLADLLHNSPTAILMAPHSAWTRRGIRDIARCFSDGPGSRCRISVSHPRRSLVEHVGDGTGRLPI